MALLSEFAYYLSITSLLFFSIFLFSLILFQDGKAGSFGSPFRDEANSMFGTSSNDVLNKLTAWSVFIFLSSCLFLSSWTSKLSTFERKIESDIETTTSDIAE